MELFSIVHTICRIAAAQPTEALLYQFDRLAKGLEESGDVADAASVRSLMVMASRTGQMTPRKLLPSKGVAVPGEVLTPNTILPSDKETGIRLVEVIFPNSQDLAMPVFSEELTRAAAQIVSEWNNVESLKAAGVMPTMSCLIVGAPGTGKTTFAYWLAQQLNLPIVLARIDAMMSSFLGTSARNITQVFGFANRFKCVLLLDEFDSLAKMRDDPNEIGEIKRVVNALLQNLDSRKDIGITLGATNHPKLLDEAVWRRFEVQLKVPMPNFEARAEIVRRSAMPIEFDWPTVAMLAGILEGVSGAEVGDFVRAYKKRYVVGAAPASPMEALKDIATLNDNRMSAEAHEILSSEETFAAWLKHNHQFSLKVKEIGPLFGKKKSTASRKTTATTQKAKSERNQRTK